MKKLLVGILALSLTANLFASCVDVYKEKAQRRDKTNKILARTGQVVIGTTFLAGSVVVSAGTGLFVLPQVFLGVAASIPIGIMEDKLNQPNNYKKTLLMISAANDNKVSFDLFDKINRKMKLYSLKSDLQNEILNEIPQIILEENENQGLCQNKKGETKALRLGNIADLVVNKLYQRLPHIETSRSLKFKKWTCTAQKDYYQGKAYIASEHKKSKAKRAAKALCTKEENVAKCKWILSCTNNNSGTTRQYF